MDWHTHTNNVHWGDCCLTISLDLKGKDYQITGKPCLKNFGYCTVTFMYNDRFLSPMCYSSYFGTIVMMVLGHEKFCYHPLLLFAYYLLKIFPLLWATLFFMHCSCMLMAERSIHRFFFII